MLLKNTLPIDGRYIQIAAKVPVFEHFLTLHHSTFRCSSYILEHFFYDSTVFSCNLVSHSALFGCFQTLPGNFSSKKPPKSWKSAHLRTLSQHYKTTQAATIRCTSLNFEHFLFRSAASYLQLVSHSALLGYF